MNITRVEIHKALDYLIENGYVYHLLPNGVWEKTNHIMRSGDYGVYL